MRRVVMAALGVVCAVGLAGCGAGQQATTSDEPTSAPGSMGAVGPIVVRDVTITWSDPVLGGAVYPPGADVPLQATIVNEKTAGPGADRLVAVSSPIAASGRIVGDARIADGQVLAAGYDQPVASIAMEGTRAIDIALVGVTTPIRSGMTYPVVFTFERAGDLRLTVGVETPQVLPPRAREGEDEPEIASIGPDIGEVDGDR